MEPVSYMKLVASRYPDQQPYEWSEFTDVPWAPLPKPIGQMRVALLASGGVYLKEQTPFIPEKNDLTWREIPLSADQADVGISHANYDKSSAKQDINCVFPLQRLRELAASGLIGGLTPVHFSFMGRIFSKRRLTGEMIPALLARLRDVGTDLALLVPA